MTPDVTYDEQRYPTSWGADQTFEQIRDDLAPLVASVLRRYYTYGADLEDSLQTGFMRLWEQLVEEPTLLTTLSRIEVAYRVNSRSKSTTLYKQNKKYLPFSVMQGDSDFDMDEYGISGYANPSAWWRSSERWAVWAGEVDIRTDIADAIGAIAEEYADDIKGLVALYILTTSVDSKAALEAHNLPHSQVYSRMADIKRRLQDLLREYEPIQPSTWQERLEAGETEPYLRVVADYQDKPLALFALYTLTTKAKIRKFVRDEKERKMITYYRKKLKKKLAIAYGCVA